jgi:hypothetical protein
MPVHDQLADLLALLRSSEPTAKSQAAIGSQVWLTASDHIRN